MEVGDERTTLLNWLTFHREGVIRKVEDLPPEPVHRQLVVSGTTLAGIVAHLTGVGRQVQLSHTARANTRHSLAGSATPAKAGSPCRGEPSAKRPAPSPATAGLTQLFTGLTDLAARR